MIYFNYNKINKNKLIKKHIMFPFEKLYAIIMTKEIKMENLYNIIVPIISSILGGLVGGLFTYLGVKLTIQNENQLKKQEEKEKNILKNKEIIALRPEFELTNNSNDVICEHSVDLYLLPYRNPKLVSKDEIYFDYDNIKFDENQWNYEELIIYNKGKTAIEAGFIELEYKNYLNVYSKTELNAWRNSHWTKNYYSDRTILPNWIMPNEKVSIKFYTHKKFPNISNRIVLNAYMVDGNNNYWYQDNINFNSHNKSCCISPSNYVVHFRDNYYKWFIYDELYYCKDIEKCFKKSKLEMEALLEKRKKYNWKLDDINAKFVHEINSGDKLLNS